MADEITRLRKEVEYYKSRYEMILQIHDTQVETIRTYHKIVKILDAELEKMRKEKNDDHI